MGNDKYSPYGTSVLEPARRIWRQLTLLEDAMMAYRIVRSPERRAFYIDVGNIPPQDVEQYMQKAMTQMKRNQVVDPDTGRVDLRYNPCLLRRITLFQYVAAQVEQRLSQLLVVNILEILMMLSILEISYFQHSRFRQAIFHPTQKKHKKIRQP